MKQIIAYVLIALTLLSHAGRTEKDAKEEQAAPETEVTEAAATETEETVAIAGVANPYTYYDSLEEINAIVGSKLAHPGVMGVTDESFCTISIPGTDSTIAQYDFTVNGIEFTYRFSADFSHDISGIYANGTTIFADAEGDAKTEYEGGKAARMLTVDGQYVLVAKDNGAYDMEQFSAIADEILASALPDLSASEFAGEWYEINAGRATMYAEAVDGVLNVEVYWSNSAFDLVYWSFSGTKTEDGIVSYTNGIKKDLVFDENGVDTEVILAENEEGYLLINTDGNIEWTYPIGDGETDTAVFAYNDYSETYASASDID